MTVSPMRARCTGTSSEDGKDPRMDLARRLAGP